jgi:coniferyl-aldehyde dehydrogenase
MMSSQHDIDLRAILDAQKAAHLQDGVPSAEQRIDRLDRALDLLVTHNDALCEAMSRDFGHRSLDQSRMTDISGTIEAVKFTRSRLRRWMRPEKRSPQFPLGLLGAKAAVHFQPKGVVGIISPWNFPVNLALAPMASAFAAGNRVMIKPSEFTPATSQLMAEIIPQYYAREEVAVVTGGIEIGEAFSRLPFDHMMFTGATSIGYHVMRAAAENLVPLTLELGGKSPVIIGATADIDQAAVRVMAGKLLNAGQVCLAPDYVFVPEGAVDAFVDAAKRAVAASYPDGLAENDDYTAVINQRHHGRLMSYLEDARAGGAELVEINPAGESFSTQHHCKMARYG